MRTSRMHSSAAIAIAVGGALLAKGWVSTQ
jgi:hypothetical protein